MTKYIIDGLFICSIISCLLCEIKAVQNGNTEKVFFWCGMTLFMVLIHTVYKWVFEELKK